MKKEKIENIDETLTLKTENISETISENSEINSGDVSITGTITALPSKIDGWQISTTPLNTKPNSQPKKYKVILSTPTKFILDVDENGQLYPMTEKYKNLISGDEIEIPAQKEGNSTELKN